MSTKSIPRARLIVDRTHLGRRASGIERITEELFSEEALSPLPVSGFYAKGPGKFAVMAAQTVQAPAAMLMQPDTVWAFSGFPPSPLTQAFRERVVMYVHDMFLLTRTEDLNRAAKLYMSMPFRRAVTKLRYFLVNSATTARNLAPYVTPDAVIELYRPKVRNVFDLQGQVSSKAPDGPLKLGAVGTIEPRKNLLAASRIAVELGRRMGRGVELHVLGRPGWGNDAALLTDHPHVTLHGFLPDAEARVLLQQFDALISTSHDEGLGLPLIEAQYGGLQIIAPDREIFREVLGDSGWFIDPDDVGTAAAVLNQHFSNRGWREHARMAAAANVHRWNMQATQDHARVVQFLSERLSHLA